jgi:hypothetical protein
VNCRTTNCCDPNPFAYRSDFVPPVDPDEPPNPNCADPAYRATHLDECGDDERCSDPVFAAANPGLCLETVRLLLKPSAAVVEVLGAVQFRAYLWENGVETELTEDVAYGVDDNAIALIGVVSGNATGLSAGITTVTATHDGMTAEAQLEVIADCAVRANHFLFLFDVSRTMENVFNGTYPTLLDFAKYLGDDFVTRSDWAKDDGAVMAFNTATSALTAFTDNSATLAAAIDVLPSTAFNTDIANALTNGRAFFNAQSVPASGRVIVLFSDGRNNTGGDPIAIADTLRSEGAVVIVIGLRARGTAFQMLERIANGGFFLNAKPDNVGGIPDWLNGLRSYLCSGNCEPCGGETLGVGALDYTGFDHWTVSGGHVDLIGRNEGGPGLYDLLPGNGLYVDDHGSSATFEGTLQTTTPFTLVSGNQYRLTVSIAGHNREDATNRSTRVQMGGYVNTLVTREGGDGFSDEVWNFTAGGADILGIIITGQATGGDPSYGNLIGSVRFENITTSTVLLEDNFDNENLTAVPEGCCEGYGYGYGDCYGSGCLDSPIPGQTPDGTALPDLEDTDSGGDTTFTSTRSYTASCPGGTTGSAVTRSATATSTVSQADADARALDAAQDLAEAALVCTRPLATNDILNFNATQSAHKTGAAAIGTAGDYWNEYFFHSPLKTAANVTTETLLDYTTGGGEGGFGWGFAASAPDAMMQEWAQDADFLYLILRKGDNPTYDGLPAGDYELYLFGHGDGDTKNATFTVDKGLFDYFGAASGLPTNIGIKTTLNGAGWATLPFVEDTHYSKFTFTLTAGQMVRVKLEKAAGIVWYWNGLQLKKVA